MVFAGWVGLYAICVVYVPFWPWMAAVVCKLLLTVGALKWQADEDRRAGFPS